jgi:hypothetical protein
VNVLLDSGIVIEILRLRDQRILSQWNTLANSSSYIFYSPVTAAEVWAGARHSEQEATSHFFQSLACAPADKNIGNLAGDYLRQFSRSHGLDIADALIAATAVLRQSTLWTRNRKRYPMPDVNFYH